jgi:uncharacterized phage infection (PIP) family protein YhgE
MPSYEEIINQSRDNLKSLSEKLKELDKLHQDIKALKEAAEGVPEIFNKKFQELAKISAEYTNTLGAATKNYLDGNNTLFTTRLSELSSKIKEFEATIEELKKQTERLEQIDIEKHFDKLQKTLSEIFGAVNAINLTLTITTQNLNSIVQSLGIIQATIDTSQKEILKHLIAQDVELKKNSELFESKIQLLVAQNQMLKKEISGNRVIQFLGFGVIVIILVYLILTLHK